MLSTPHPRPDVSHPQKRRVIVVGAGPAGLAAAWELVNQGHVVTVLERDPEHVGGLARTMEYKGFRFDIGAHRFFSKNADICRWWHERLPGDFVRIKRLTRIHYRGRFFRYPLRVGDALRKLGFSTSVACMISYLKRLVKPAEPERSFEDWVINKFGDRLYRIFFKAYTEKVWGMACADISADWASQRIRGLSLRKAMLNAIGLGLPNIKTLTDEFEYPRLGPGMLWERTRDDIVTRGGRVVMGRAVTKIRREGDRIEAICTATETGEVEWWQADEFIVSMPLRDCVLAVDPPLEEATRNAAKRLAYRDFVVVALIVNRNDLFPDNWIYIHDPAVKVARVANYNNWSKEMAHSVTCLEMEYFCSKGDALWELCDGDFMALARRELEHLGLAEAKDVMDGSVVRVEKTYPVYDAVYRQNVNTIRHSLARLENLQTVGRNGMHKYNNQDHSMLTGILAARNVDGSGYDVWRVNTDAEYQEEEAENSGRSVPRPLAVAFPSR